MSNDQQLSVDSGLREETAWGVDPQQVVNLLSSFRESLGLLVLWLDENITILEDAMNNPSSDGSEDS